MSMQVYTILILLVRLQIYSPLDEVLQALPTINVQRVSPYHSGTRNRTPESEQPLTVQRLSNPATVPSLVVLLYVYLLCVLLCGV